MGFITLNLGLTLTIPTNGTKNWGDTLKSTTWTKISQHAHTGSGDGNQMTTASYSDFSVTTQKLAKNVGVTQAATMTPSGGSQTIDWNSGNAQVLDCSSASGTIALTLSNPAKGSLYTLFVKQGATARDLTWPAGMKWPGGQAPILSTANGSVDKIVLYYDGTIYFGDWDLNYS